MDTALPLPASPLIAARFFCHKCGAVGSAPTHRIDCPDRKTTPSVRLAGPEVQPGAIVITPDGAAKVNLARSAVGGDALLDVTFEGSGRQATITVHPWQDVEVLGEVDQAFADTAAFLNAGAA